MGASRSPARARTGPVRAWVGLLLLPLPVEAAMPYLPTRTGLLVYLGVVSALSVVIVGALLWPRRRLPSGSWALTAGLFVRLVSDGVLAVLLFQQVRPGISGPALAHLASAILVMIGLARLVPRAPLRRMGYEAFVDAGVATFGVGLAVWALAGTEFLTIPVERMNLPVGVVLTLAAVSVWVLVCRLLFLGAGRPGEGLVAISVALLLVSEVFWWPPLLVGSDPRPGLAVTVAAAAALAAAVLRSAAGPLPNSGGGRRLEWVSTRLAVFVGLIAVSPITVVVAVVRGERLDPFRDVLVPVVAIALLTVLLVIHVHRLAVRAQRRALRDPLTGVANRTALTDLLHRAVERVPGRPSQALLLLDLDGFKDVNDGFGHPVGDALLVAVAGRVADGVPAGGTLARLGGDEFAVYLPRADRRAAGQLANQLVRAIREPFRVDNRELYVTASVGVRTLEGLDPRADPRTDPVETQPTASGLLSDADLALYAAKRAGKNQAVGWHPTMRDHHAEQTRIATGLRRAVVRNEFTVHYQPVVDLATAQVTAVEALVRWNPPDGRMVSPDVFVRVAEETGLIVPLGAWVLERACTDAKEWHDRLGLSVSVNVSGRQLRDPKFVDTVFDTLRRSGLPARALMLELTETTLMAATLAEPDPTVVAVSDAATEALSEALPNTATPAESVGQNAAEVFATSGAVEVAGQLQRLRQGGIRVAIDDFGTGYSSLAYLRDLPVDVLKIDRSFSRDGDEPGSVRRDSQDTALTQAILQICRSLGLTTVAEGVETTERAQLLRELGCSFAQGYLFSPPVPAVAVAPLVETVSESLRALGSLPAGSAAR